MKKIFAFFFRTRFIWFLILLSLPIFWQLLGSGYFSMHDDLQVSRLYQMDLCFRDGQIPCRWVPDMGYGYGYPLFNYYPPLPYYLGEIFHLFGFSFINSIKILFILSLVFSGIFAYLLGKELWGKYGGLVVGVFYLYAPYHAVDVYVRGALNEFFGLVLFPAVFWAVLKLIKQEKKVYIIWLGFFVSLLLLSHNLMAFFITPFLVVWALFLIIWFKKSWRLFWWLACAALWGLGLGAFFTLPVLFERNMVHVETMFIGYFNYLAHFANISQMFFSRFWGYGASTWGPEDGMPFPLGQLHWGLPVLSFLIFSFLFLKKKKKEFYFIILFFLSFLATAFLAHQRSSFVWQFFPFLAAMQFPWRFVGLSVFFATLLSGSFFILIKNEKLKIFLSAFLIFFVLLFNLSFFRPERILDINDSEKLFSVKGWNRLQTDAIFDYLPISAPQPPAGPAPESPFAVEGQVKINNLQKGTDWLNFQLQVESPTAVLRLPLYNFPNWRVWVDDKQVIINDQNDLGLLTFDVEEGDHQVKAALFNTPIRTFANFFSLFSWLILLLIILRNYRQKKLKLKI